MNIAFFLTPKKEVVWLPAEATLAHAIEILRPHRYSAVPVLDRDGSYAGTLTEGDILWHVLASGGSGFGASEAAPPALHNVLVGAVPRRTRNCAVRIDAEIETFVLRAMHQNFVPVVDDREVFIGIVRRQHIIEHCAHQAGIVSDRVLHRPMKT